MVISLLFATFVVALAVASIIAFLFNKPIDNIMKRVVPADISYAWTRYLRFAILVVGVGGGVQIWSFDKYLTPQDPSKGIGVVQLTSERWVLEIYNTIISALQSTAMVLLVFFVFALIAVVIVRVFEFRSAKTETPK